MKKLKIQIPDGYVIDTDKSDTAKGEIYFKKAGLSYEDVAKALFKGNESYFTNWSGDINLFTDNEALLLGCSNSSTTREQLESILALNKLCNVAKYLNGDWLPEDNMIKFYIISNRGQLTTSDSSWIYSSNVYFKSRKAAQQAISILGEEEIKKALTLNH